MTTARLGASGPVIKLLTAPAETYHDGGAAVTIDWSKGPNQKVTLGAGAAPCVVTSQGLRSGETVALTLQVQQDATGNRTIAFAGGQKATPFVLSTAANANDLIDLLWDGTVLLASIRGKAYA